MRHWVVLCSLVVVGGVSGAAASFDPNVARLLPEYIRPLDLQLPLQGDISDPWARQCGRDVLLVAQYGIAPGTQRVELWFSHTCGLYTQAWDAPGPHAYFAIRARQGLQVYQAVAYVRGGRGEEPRLLCQENGQGDPEVPYGVVDWSDSQGGYRFVGVRHQGDSLAEGTQAVVVQHYPSHSMCFHLLCVRGQGACTIPFRW